MEQNDDSKANLPATLTAFTPVPRQVDRSNGWKPHVQQAFIEALADTGSVKAACERVNRSTHGAYHLRRQPGAEEFAAAWEAAVDLGMRRVEDIAMDRALNGVEVPVYSYGKLVGTRVVHNDRLLMFMLRNRASERYGEGKRKGPDAIDQMELARLKKKWRKEWEREWGAEQLRREQQTIESINAKIDAIRAKEEAAAALEEKHRARRAANRRTPEQEDAAWAAEHGPSEEQRKLLPGYRREQWEAEKREREARQRAEPRVRTLRDESWRD